MIVMDIKTLCEISKAAIDVAVAFNNDGLPECLTPNQDRALAQLDLVLAPLTLEHFDTARDDG